MLSWQVGRVKITRNVEMDLPVPAKVIPQATAAELRKSAWLCPYFVGEDDNLKLSIHALLVEAPGLKLVVDTCVGNDRPREITGGQPLATPFLQHLGEAGWSRDRVDAVVGTHLHVDHVGWNTMLEDGKWAPTFPKARYLIGRREYDFWSAHDDEEQQAMLGKRQADLRRRPRPAGRAGPRDFSELRHCRWFFQSNGPIGVVISYLSFFLQRKLQQR
jgi:glyoxylase-like metal-dependent hydrolase (beta-lactamase superfamily II)